MSKHDQLAQSFLDRFELAIHADHAGDDCPAWCDGKNHIHGKHFEVAVMSKIAERELRFDYWSSLKRKEEGDPPSEYEILFCLAHEIYCLEDFNEDEFDAYGKEKVEAMMQLHDSAKFFFSEEEMLALKESFFNC